MGLSKIVIFIGVIFGGRRSSRARISVEKNG